MTVRVGVIGTGMIGQDHIRRITQVVSGGAVTAVTDVDAARAASAAAALTGVTVHPSGRDLIADPAVDAVLVTSWAQTHAEHVLTAIDAGKPVFCEKPLATTHADGEAIMKAEVAAGRRLVQVGFMRRYDAGYRALKAAVDDGAIGTPLLMHCTHRNASVPPYAFTTESMISDSAIHEIDLVRWLFGEEIVATAILKPRRSSKGSDSLHDPLIVLLETASGILVDVEVFVNATYGYDIRGEVVGEHGTVALGDHGGVVVSVVGQAVLAGARGLAGTVRPGLRRRVPGLAQRAGGRGAARAEQLGRRRGDRGGGGLPGRAAQRGANCGGPAGPAGVLWPAPLIP